MPERRQDSKSSCSVTEAQLCGPAPFSLAIKASINFTITGLQATVTSTTNWPNVNDSSIPFVAVGTQENVPDVFGQLDVWFSRLAGPDSTACYREKYSAIVPNAQTLSDNVLPATMAQIYPEDRGTNYAVLPGFEVADRSGLFGVRLRRFAPGALEAL